MSEKQENIKQRVLIVEDDHELAGLIKEYLENAEMSVTLHHQGFDAVEVIIEQQPDLLVLDLMLPGKDGISICRECRAHFPNPILMLTASGDSVDHILGLEVGADDFMHKPVEPRILLAHIRALLRRAPAPAAPSVSANVTKTGTNEALQSSGQDKTGFLKFGRVAIDTVNRTVKIGEERLDFTTPEYDILLLLAEKSGTIMSREDIFQALRGIEYDGQNRLVDINICQIRSKLAKDGDSHRHIKTIRNKGYVCIDDIN